MSEGTAQLPRPEPGRSPGIQNADRTAEQVEQRALTLLGFNRPQEAITEVRQGLASFPEEGSLWGLDAWLQFFHGDRDAARTSAERALGLQPTGSRGRIVLIELAVAADDPGAALAHARVLVEQYPHWADAHHNHAFALHSDARGTRAERRERREQIRRAVRTALELDAENTEVLRRSAALLHNIGEEDEARRLLDSALAISPDDESLLLLNAQITPGSVTQEVRLLTGVLAQNPQQRTAARELSSTVWFRTQLLAALSTFVLAGMMLFAGFLFGEPISVSHRATMDLAYVFLALPLAWITVFVGIAGALPGKYLRRLFRPVWWVWPSLLLAAIAGLLTLFLGLTFALRSQPTQLEMNGAWVGGSTAAIGVVAALALTAELSIVLARFCSEERNQLYPRDAEGMDAAGDELRSALGAQVRVVLAVALALLPVVAAALATRPEAAGGFAPVAVALGAPAVLTLVLRWGRMRSRAQARQVLIGPVALLLAVISLVVTVLLAQQHLAQNDPPPTPWELKMQEQSRKLHESQEQFEDLGDIDVTVPDLELTPLEEPVPEPAAPRSP